MPTLVFETLPALHLVVSYQRTECPTDEEWNAYVDAVAAAVEAPQLPRVLVITEGGRPNRRQQSHLVKRVGRARASVAVLSPTTAVRFIVSILALVNPRIRSFAADQLEEAFGHLDLKLPEHAIVEAAVQRLRVRLESPATSAA